VTIEPTAVYPPPRYNPPTGNGYQQGGGRYYVINQPSQPINFPRRVWNSVPQQAPTATMSHRLPEFLRSGPMNNRAVVFNMWIIAMIIVSFDEWHNLGILPRPARLWDTSLVYGLLVLLGFVDPLVPISNALAMGFTFQLLWQYFQGNITPAAGQSTTDGTSSNPTNANLGPLGGQIAAGVTTITGG
jgi:hypothetical protein